MTPMRIQLGKSKLLLNRSADLRARRRVTEGARWLVRIFSFLLLCCCAAVSNWSADCSSPSRPPGEIAFNKGAGRGGHLYLTLRTAWGQRLLFMVDTGSSGTILDQSLEPKLGKCLGSKTLKSYYGVLRGEVYAAPELYLGHTRLLTGRRIVTLNLCSKKFPIACGRPISGILGIDCLRHYCVQLDFAADKMRFLDPDTSDKSAWGKEIFMPHGFGGKYNLIETVTGARNQFTQIDTGDYSDGHLTFGLFRQWTNHSKIVTHGSWHLPRYPDGTLAGNRYTDLHLHTNRHLNGNSIGLRFLARNLVTLDFPKRNLYLLQQSVGPLTNENDSADVFFGSTLGWWEPGGRASSSTNAVSLLAQRILSPPNLRPGAAMSKLIQMAEDQPWWRPTRIPVGPPAASLVAVQVPPGDYHERIESRIKSKDGKHGSFSFQISSTGTNPPALSLQDRGTIFLLHDYNSQMELMSGWAFTLAQAGYHVVLVDLRGHGASTGQVVSYGKYETSDLEQVLDFMTNNPLKCFLPHGSLVDRAPVASGKSQDLATSLRRRLLSEQAAKRRASRKVGVLGVGYGADLALYWAARDPRVGTVVAIAPYNQPQQAFERIAAKHHITPTVIHQALTEVARRLHLRWADWSGKAAMQHIKTPVFLIGGGRDSISTTNDLQTLSQAAPPGSKTRVIPLANHTMIGFCFHELAEPVKAWFRGHLNTGNSLLSESK